MDLFSDELEYLFPSENNNEQEINLDNFPMLLDNFTGDDLWDQDIKDLSDIVEKNKEYNILKDFQLIPESETKTPPPSPMRGILEVKKKDNMFLPPPPAPTNFCVNPASPFLLFQNFKVNSVPKIMVQMGPERKFQRISVDLSKNCPEALTTKPCKYRIRVISNSPVICLILSNQKINLNATKKSGYSVGNGLWEHNYVCQFSFTKKYQNDRKTQLIVLNNFGVQMFVSNSFCVYGRRKDEEKLFWSSYCEKKEKITGKKRKRNGKKRVKKKRKFIR